MAELATKKIERLSELATKTRETTMVMRRRQNLTFGLLNSAELSTIN